MTHSHRIGLCSIRFVSPSHYFSWIFLSSYQCFPRWIQGDWIGQNQIMIPWLHYPRRLKISSNQRDLKICALLSWGNAMKNVQEIGVLIQLNESQLSISFVHCKTIIIYWSWSLICFTQKNHDESSFVLSGNSFFSEQICVATFLDSTTPDVFYCAW